MKSERISDALNELDSKYIETAMNYRRKRKNTVWRTWVALAACLCFAGFSVFALETQLVNNTETPEPVLKEELSAEEKEKKLAELRAKATLPGEVFKYQEKEIMDPNDPKLTRLTREDLTEILKNESDGLSIYVAIKQKQPYADKVWGSGVDNEEFWLDGTDNGDKIMVIAWGTMIQYLSYENGEFVTTIIYKHVYTPKQ